MSETIRAVDRALDILLCFSRQTPQLSMTQIAEQVGMNKSTVHRLLGTLERKRFVQRDLNTNQYRLGIRLMQMAYLTMEQSDLRHVAGPIMQQLCEQFQETITLAIMDEADVVFLDVVESTQRVKLAASIGQRMPAFATAAGKIIMAFSNPDSVRMLLEKGMRSYTPTTVHSQETFLRELVQVHEDEFAISDQEYEAGINAVAALIKDGDGKPVGAVSVAGPAFRLTKERMRAIGPQLVATAREISQVYAATSTLE
jgi:IclR family transcriptional regulator, KDG regulon repressor